MRPGSLWSRVAVGVGASTAAALLGLLAAPSAASADSILPSPLASPVGGLLGTVTGIVNPVVNQVPVVGPVVTSTTQAVTGAAAPPAASGGTGGASTGQGSAPGSSDQGGQASPPPAPQPPPAEQAALPPEPGRVALEQQQTALADEAAPADQLVNGSLAPDVIGNGGSFGWPIVFTARPPITQPFGCTDVAGEPYDPSCPSHRTHTGIDLAVPLASPVYASSGGVAHEFVGGSGYGNYVLISQPDGWFTLYGHLSGFVVADGQAVQRGTMIARSGNTGFSSGPHLHFEIRRGSKPVDPCSFLNCGTTNGSAG